MIRLARTCFGATLRLVAILAVLAALAQPALAAGSSSPPPAVSAEELQKLVSTLEDSQARTKLVEQIKGLIAAQRAQKAPEEPGVVASLSERIDQVGEEVLASLESLRDVPSWMQWIGNQAANPEARERWGLVLLNLLAVLGAGLAADRLTRWALSRARAKLAPPEQVPLLMRLPLALLRWLIDLVPVAAFAAAAHGVGLVLKLKGSLPGAALMLVIAYSGVQIVNSLVRLLVAPRTPTLRLLPVDSETAEYLLIWARRLAVVALFGHFCAEALRLLGLPKAGYLALTKALGLSLTAMLVIFILQNRRPVARLITTAAERWNWNRRLRAVTGRLADIWHVLACIYVVAVLLVWAIPVKGGFEYILTASLSTVVVLALAGGLSSLVRRGIERGFRVSQEARERFPGLEERVNRYLPILHVVLRGLIAVTAGLFILNAWGMRTLDWLGSDIGRRVLASGISIATVVVGALLVWEMVSGAIERYLSSAGGSASHTARARTLLPLARNALMVVLVVMVTLIVLSELGINIAPLLAGAGVVGVAVGFGSQKLVQDVITGAFILFEDTIAVGDVVKLDSNSGTVEAISIRAIRLRDGNGSIHTIPFSNVGRIVNMTRDYSYAVMDVGVAYSEDTDRVSAVLREVGASMQADPALGAKILGPLEVLGVERLDTTAVVIRVRLKTVAAQQWAVTRAFNRLMKQRFDQEGIEFPPVPLLQT